MSRREQFTLRAVGIGALLGAAVVLSGCVTTVDGRAVAAATIGPLTTTTGTPSPAAGTATTPATSTPTDPTPSAASVTATTTDAVAPDSDAPVDMAVGESIVSWDDRGEADIYVRDARFEGSGSDTVLRVTVDYECWDGDVRYALDDWSLVGADGHRVTPAAASTFGADTDEPVEVGIITDGTQKRGHLVFDVPPGAATLEFGQLWGDPATWLVPAP